MRTPRLARPSAASILLLALILAPAAQAGEWQGQEVTDLDGVLHMENPAAPLNGHTTVDLVEQWRLGGADGDEIFGVITKVLTDDEGNLYVLDSQLSEISVYDPQGNLLRTMGREGEGPGEFRMAQDMFFLDDGRIAVLQVFPGRIPTLTKDGEPGEDYPIPTADGGGQAILRQGGGSLGGPVAISLGLNNFDQATGSFTQNRMIVIAQDGEILHTLHSEPRSIQFGGAVVMKEKQWDSFDRVWGVTPDHRIYANVGWDDYSLKIWNDQGELERIIERDYESRPRTSEEIAERKGIFEQMTARQMPGSPPTWEMESVDKDFEGIYPRQDGSIWILTSRGRSENPEGSLGTFDIFDPRGRFLKQVTLMGEGDPQDDSYFFAGDRVFVVTDLLAAAMAAQGVAMEDEEEEPEPMSIICYRLGDFDVGMR